MRRNVFVFERDFRYFGTEDDNGDLRRFVSPVYAGKAEFILKNIILDILSSCKLLFIRVFKELFLFLFLLIIELAAEN